MPTFKCAVIKEAGGKFEFEEREIPTPARGEVLLKVKACGVCHSDKFTVFNAYPGCSLPRVPGHEVIGTVESVGEGVDWPPTGLLVGVGWHHDHCLFCEACRRGDFMMCPKSRVSGIHADGGYAEYMIAPWTGIAELPQDIDPVAAAPLLCAGITVFNSMRNQENVGPGDLVAVQGIGGLGHLGIQFAKKMGFQVAAVSSSGSKKELAEKLGADHYIDTSVEPASAQLQKLGGAKLVLATAPNAKSMEDLVNALGSNGRLLIVGADADKFSLSPFQVIPNRGHVCGWPSGTGTDCTDCCNFAKNQGIASMNEVFPLDKAQEAYDYMMSGKARFRVVLTP
ncbi:Probable formaldehyde dehydrogenase AdhA [Seminavis robusta]|uniref:Probable formaldehyde dehydrogenase AdhA n=1 Tax=Seminavis robusta TaxID=568900 RepID=A0A9N8E050_9STRA|nr:Probable formaldehyde dehydrogenase AdhA [Seminavis robusta]|eukprot:Sro405_g136090.1 Probable formaldehyde dehydrogenase AdhA (339) ;mRNA; r:22492-23508